MIKDHDDAQTWLEPYPLEYALRLLSDKINRSLDEIHNRLICDMDWLARSTGQRLRADRLS